MTPTTVELLKLIFLSSVTIGLWLGINLTFTQRGLKSANLYLMAFIFLTLLPPLNMYREIAFTSWPWFRTLSTNVLWLYGPFLFAIVETSRNQSFTHRALLIHSIPFLCTLVLRLSPMDPAFSLFLWPIFFHTLCYLAACINALKKHWLSIDENIKQHKKTHILWLMYLVAGLFFLILFETLCFSQIDWKSGVISKHWFIASVVLSIYIVLMAIYSIYRPRVFFNECFEEDPALKMPEEKISRTTDQSDITETQAQALKAELTNLMEKEKVFLDNSLSHKDLSKKMGITRHQLSDLLNLYLNKSFYELVNSYRVEEACKLIASQSEPTPLINIAFDSGFNNKNTFNRYFKIQMGMTPSEYKKKFHTENYFSGPNIESMAS